MYANLIKRPDIGEKCRSPVGDFYLSLRRAISSTRDPRFFLLACLVVSRLRKVGVIDWTYSWSVEHSLKTASSYSIGESIYNLSDGSAFARVFGF